MLGRLVRLCISARGLVLALLVLLLAAGGWAASRLPIDAIPDVSPVQVSVLTEAPGYSADEIERAVTFPLENALNGVPGMVQLRSTSRGDISAISIVFEDGTDPWFARQAVFERIQQAAQDLPPGVGTPELAPLSNGLGEIFQFVLRSEIHSDRQLRTILDWQIGPRLRSVPGVIEVNAFGGQLKQYQVVLLPGRLRAHDLSVEDVAEALRRASATARGGYVDRGPEAYTLRATGRFEGEDGIRDVVLRSRPGAPPVLVRHVAEVRTGAALPQGVVTHDGEREAVTGIVMMLLGGNSREVVHAVKDEIEAIEADLPPGVVIEPVYDRADFVDRTVATVVTNLGEGVLIVTLVLTVLLGSVRGAIVVVIGIPASMSVALLGMRLTGVTGDLMSLGAIDFGFLVDGAIVVLEALLAVVAGRELRGELRKEVYAEAIGSVARPVAFAVAIIMLVYLPLLGLEGVEGKMFRPMAITMAFALLGALVYAVVFLPAMLVTFVPPPRRDPAAWLAPIERGYARLLQAAVQARWGLLALSAGALVMAGSALAGAGANFVPRIAEGDAVVTIRRAPSISLGEAKRLDLAAQRALRRFPEVEHTLAMTGRAEVATDPVGKDNTDILVSLAPDEAWVSASDLDELSVLFKDAVETEAPGSFASVSQPIEDRTNELISGSRADVQIMLHGEDLETLRELSERVAGVVRRIDGTGDVRVERVIGLPELVVVPDRAKMARHGVTMESALAAIEAARVGVPVGAVFEGHRRFELRLLAPPRNNSPAALGDLVVESHTGASVPLSEIATVEEREGPAQIRRQDRERAVRVDVNLRGRDLVSWVSEAQATVGAIDLPTGYRIEWGGQFENFERASKRLAIIVPLALGIVFAMLVGMFGQLRYAIAVFLVVPFATTGGIVGLLARDMPFSIPAAVGFIALAGVAVLNGVVLTSQVRDRLRAGASVQAAVIEGSTHTMRAVITTAAVAALGFLPMALAQSAGAEVQRPLATVVIFGIGVSTLMTMFVLPGILRIVLQATKEDRT